MTLDAQSTNATATFYTQAPAESDDPYEDTDDWQAVHEDIDVWYNPSIVHREFAASETGDQIRREDDIYAPLAIADDHVEGDRVDVTFRGQTDRWRINALAPMAFQDDVEGLCRIAVTDFGDT